MTDDRLTLGGNSPPLADQIELAYSLPQLATDFATLADDAVSLKAQSSAILVVNSTEESAAAGASVIALRAMLKALDDARAATKEPLFRGGQNIDAYFKGASSPLATEKTRLEKLIGDHGFRVAQEERRIREEAAAAERKRAEEAAKAAAEQEALNRQPVADAMLEQAVKAEGFADRFEAQAVGRVQDLARQRTESATIGLRAVPGYEITDRDALKATLGPLRDSFTADAVDAAIRRFRAAQGEMAFEKDDVNEQRRNVVSVPPLPGVCFFIDYKGSVRA